ncbi:MAG: hypothetical protein QJR03_15010 [Sphaerobacter sp.]|nr:hypothetical protein [Sphaerobacter sp.]
MALRLLLNGTDYTSWTEIESLEASDSLTTATNTCRFRLVIRSGQVAAPIPGAEIKWQVGDAVNGWRNVFAGVLARITESIVAPDSLAYDCECTDYLPWFNRHLVAEDYPSQGADDIVRAIVTNYANQGMAPGYTFSANHVETAPVVPTQQFAYVSPGDAIGQLAQLLSWLWYIDYDRDVHFFGLEGEPAPLPGGVLDCTLGAGNLAIGDLTVTSDMTQLKNRVFVMGYKVRSTVTITDTFTGDGQTTTFYLSEEPSHNLGDITVTVGGVAYVPKRDIADGQPGNDPAGNFAYFNYGQHSVRFTTAPANGAAIQVTYKYLIDAVLMREEPQAQQWQRIHADGATDGIYEYRHDNPGLPVDDQSYIDLMAAQLLYRYAWQQKSGSFTVFVPAGSGYTPWRAGQHFTFQSHGTRFGGLLDGETMWVVKVTTTVASADAATGAVTLKHEIDWANTPYLG